MSDWPNRGWRRSFDGFGRQLAKQSGEAVERWRHRAFALVDRWERLRRGERMNVALYVLTAVSMLALTVEFLAGPDTLRTEVTSAPGANGSSGLTPVVPVSTTGLTLPPTTVGGGVVPGQIQAQPEPPPTTARQSAAIPAAPPSSAAPADPPPADPPPTDPPPTAPPTTATPTTRAPATTVNTGLNIVPPVPPSFP